VPVLAVLAAEAVLGQASARAVLAARLWGLAFVLALIGFIIIVLFS